MASSCTHGSAHAQERFNADFEALRHRKRGCLDRLAALQRRVAELAAQAAALGFDLGADGKISIPALLECEDPQSVLTVTVRLARCLFWMTCTQWLVWGAWV